jgi:serine/threonine-protein kinase
VALKVLRSTANEKAVASLLGEARVAGRLVHPNVVTVHDVGVDQGRGFIAMELVEGGSLARWLGAERRSPQQVIDVFLAAGEGLAAAHRAGLVHRDFKPANVLMGTDGRPRVADFGLATATPQPLDPSDAPLTGTSAGGTPGYMAPEQYFRKADARSDEFAFCVSLWQALAGARPFATGENALETIRSGRPAGRIPRSVGRRARRALLRGMSFNPEDRFLSMEALLAELRAPRSLRRASAVILVAAVTATAAATATVVMRWRLPAPGPDQVAPAQTQPADATPKPDVAGPDASQGQGERDAAVPGEAIAAKAPSTHVKKGRLTVLVNPWAQVSVDGHKWGTTPLPPIELGDGKHSLVLVNPELGVRRTVTATMRQGRDVTLRINLLE